MPPPDEQSAVALLAGHGARVQIDDQYRVIALSLGFHCTDEDLRRAADCERLASLTIQNSKITAEGLLVLRRLPRLSLLRIESSGMTNQELDALRSAMPNCRISAGQRSSMSLLSNPVVLDELALSPQQREQIDVATDPAVHEQSFDLALQSILSAEQYGRLRELSLQKAGAIALLRDDIAARLKISRDVQASIQSLSMESSAALEEERRKLTQDKLTAITAAKMSEVIRTQQQARDEKILKLLTEEQQVAWQAMQGAKFDFNNREPLGNRPLPNLGPLAARVANRAFDRLDTDGDGLLSEVEFPRTDRTHQQLLQSGIAINFPISRANFEQAHEKLMQARLPRP